MNKWVYWLIIIIWIADLYFLTWPKTIPEILSVAALIAISLAAGISLANLIKKD